MRDLSPDPSNSDDLAPKHYVDGGGLFRDLRDKRILQSCAIGGGSTALTSAGTGPTGTGTATAAALAYTSKYAAVRRVDYLVTTAATTAVAGLRGNSFCAIGVSGYPNSGFEGRIIAGPATGLTGAPSTHRFFMGLRNSTSAPTDAAPNAQVSCIGMGWDSGDANVQLYYNDGSGTCTKGDSGYARPTTDRTATAGALYQMYLKADAAASSISYSMVDVINNATILAGSVNTNIPAATTTLCPIVWSSVGGTSSVVGITFVDWYFESVNGL